jgi:hypothetical protein
MLMLLAVIARRSASAPVPAIRRRAHTLVSWPAPPSAYPNKPPPRTTTTVPPPSGVHPRFARREVQVEVDVEVDVEADVVEIADADIEDIEDDTDDDADDVVIELVHPRSGPPPLPTLRLEGIAELEKESSSWRAAGIAASSLAKALRARTVLVHALDVQREELRTIGVDGPRAPTLLGCVATLDEDLIASTVVANGRAMTLRVEDGLPRFVPERLSIASATRSVVAVPIMCGPRCLGMIEVVDADEQLFTRVEEACKVVSKHLAIVL